SSLDPASELKDEFIPNMSSWFKIRIPMPQVLQLDSRDNVLIALTDLKEGDAVEFAGERFALSSRVPAKHKFATQDLSVGAPITMYGVLVGKASQPIRKGELLTLSNIHHEAAPYAGKQSQYHWTPPDVSRWKARK